MAISKELYNIIYIFLKEKISQKIKAYSLDEEDAAKPFQFALFTKKGYLTKGFIHGVETSLGNWHESIAQKIARYNFKESKKLKGNEKLTGKVTKNAQIVIDNILQDLDSAKRQPNANKELQEVVKASKIGKSVGRIQRVDLFLEKYSGGEIYFEIKGPKPNKNEMKAAKRDLLEIAAMRANEGKKIQLYLGMYYNPYYPKEYERWTVLKFFDPGADFLIGKDFWDFLGGKGTYEQLIEIFEKMGKEIRPILDKKFESLLKKFDLNKTRSQRRYKRSHPDLFVTA